MGRILAIDYGRKRSGIAVSDTLRMIANGLTTVPTDELVDFLKSYFKEEQVDEVVIGDPKQMNNTPSEAVSYVHPFIKRFKKLFPDIPLFLMDERFTSKMAVQAMIEGGLNKKQRRDKSLVDKISATLILQSYLETKNL